MFYLLMLSIVLYDPYFPSIILYRLQTYYRQLELLLQFLTTMLILIIAIEKAK